MKKKVISLICSMLVLSGMTLTSITDVAAEDVSLKRVDGSYLTVEESSSGHTTSNPFLRGKHLMDGDSTISKAGKGRVYAYGATTANHTVDFIAVLVYLDQYNEKDDCWEQVAQWHAEDEDTYYVSIGNSQQVDGGYYYRVRSEHIAGNDADYPYDSATSLTDGIWIP